MPDTCALRERVGQGGGGATVCEWVTGVSSSFRVSEWVRESERGDFTLEKKEEKQNPSIFSLCLSVSFSVIPARHSVYASFSLPYPHSPLLPWFMWFRNHGLEESKHTAWIFILYICSPWHNVPLYIVCMLLEWRLLERETAWYGGARCGDERLWWW